MKAADNALEQALSLIRAFEGCRLRAYRDLVGVWTIGWGETLGVTEGMVWTQAQADAVLRRRVGQYLLGVLKRCPALHLEPPARLAACVSLAYNIGLGAFGASSVCRKLMRQDLSGAADSFLLWNKAGGWVVAGLTRRRRAERRLFLDMEA
ncbi:lysozyme [Massilia sp. erpn]|uniref:lysozyme n=1 Tax=Massilia sp. erpn TaxID=2738142 RepID=UPI0021072C94|nr:lysozyme [Massilia sp. erpn]UTY60391.1 lysozyme [Massilia sp. erpn]